MQDFVAIGEAYLKLEHSKIWSNFEFDRIIFSGTGTMEGLAIVMSSVYNGIVDKSWVYAKCTTINCSSFCLTGSISMSPIATRYYRGNRHSSPEEPTGPLADMSMHLGHHWLVLGTGARFYCITSTNVVIPLPVDWLPVKWYIISFH